MMVINIFQYYGSFFICLYMHLSQSICYYFYSHYFRYNGILKLCMMIRKFTKKIKKHAYINRNNIYMITIKYAIIKCVWFNFVYKIFIMVHFGSVSSYFFDIYCTDIEQERSNHFFR